MSRLLLGGGMVAEAVTTFLTMPDGSQTSVAPWLVGAALMAVPHLCAMAVTVFDLLLYTPAEVLLPME